MQGPIGHWEDFGGSHGSVLGRGGTWGLGVRTEAGVTGRDYSSHPGERQLDGSKVRRSRPILDPFQSKS